MTDTAPSSTYLNLDEYRDCEITDVHPADLNRLCDEIVSLRQQLALQADSRPEFHVATDIAVVPAMVTSRLPDHPPLPMLRFEFADNNGPLVPIHLIQHPEMIRDLRLIVGNAIDNSLKGVRRARSHL